MCTFQWKEPFVDELSLNLNIPDIAFQDLNIYMKLLVRKTLTTAHNYPTVLHNNIRQCYCLGASALIEDCHM